MFEEENSCETNCQCSGLITENFKINSGNNATKRKQEGALTSNFKLKMNPYSLDFNTPLSPLSPKEPKRRVLGEIQNSIFQKSPLIDRLKSLNSPINQKTFANNVSNLLSPKLKSPISISSPKVKSPTQVTPKVNSPILVSPELNSPTLVTPKMNSPTLVTPKVNSPTLVTPQVPFFSPKPCTSRSLDRIVDRKPRSLKRNLKISKIFEERTMFKMSNKENTEPVLSETFMNIDVEDARDYSFSGKYESDKKEDTKLDFTGALKTSISDTLVPETTLEPEEDVMSLQDLEAEFEADNFDMCTKYEIISTDSPNIISRGRTSSSRKVNQKDFEFGAPISETESSTSFNKPNTSATRMLNFEETSPVLKKNTSLSVKKSLKFNDTPTKMYMTEEFETPSKIPKLDQKFDRMSNTPETHSGIDDYMQENFSHAKYPFSNIEAASCINFDLTEEARTEFIQEDYRKTLKENSGLNFNLCDEASVNFTNTDLARIENNLSTEENSMNFNQTPNKSIKTKKTGLNFSGVFRSPQSSPTFNSQTIMSQHFSSQSQLYSGQNYKTHTPTRLRHEKSDSSIGSMSSTPCKIRFPSESMTSMESGFISELEEPFLEIEESNSPKISNFNDLLSGQIKSNILSERNTKKVKNPLHNISRSLSFNPEKTKILFSINESPEKKSNKRTERSEEEVSYKRRKSNCMSPEVVRPVLHRAFSDTNASIMSALARSVVEPDLIGDFSLPFALPLTAGNHSDLKSISSDTLAELINGQYNDTIKEFQVIDCRYPYEFEGGHIVGAVNMYTPAQVLTLVERPLQARQPQDRRSILVFHCEFSLERGPKLSRFLRSSDREHNKDNYPSLHYPEIYLLHEGYRAFYQKHPNLCSPVGYTAMLDPKHSHLLRKHRSVRQPSGQGLRRSRLLM